MKRVISVREEIYGPNHLQVGSALCDLAEFYKDEDREADPETEYCLVRALSIFEGVFGAEHIVIYETLWELVETYDAQGHAEMIAPLRKRIPATLLAEWDARRTALLARLAEMSARDPI